MVKMSATALGVFNMLGQRNCMLLMALVVGSWSSVSCKKTQSPETSQGQSVEAIIAGNVDLRGEGLCGKDATLTNDTKPEEALNKAYNAAPAFLKRPEFFPSIASIKTYDDVKEVAKVCKEALKKNPKYASFLPADDSKSEMFNLIACGIVGTREDGKLAPMVHIQNNAKVIYNNLIRTMVWSFSELMDVSSDQLKNNPAIDVKKAQSFFDELMINRRSLVEATFIGLNNSNNVAAKAAREKYIAVFFREKADQDAARATPSKLYEVHLLQHFILSEVADSYYCSLNSFSKIQSALSQATLCSFKPFVDTFGKPFFADEAEYKNAKVCPSPINAAASTVGTPTASGSLH